MSKLTVALLVTLGALSATASADTLGVAQTTKPVAENSVYLELGGNSALYTINYERFVRPDASIRVGMMYMSVTATASSGDQMASASASWLSVPVMFQYLGVANGNHALELAGGVDLMHFSGSASTFDATASAEGMVVVPTATVGYRYSNPAGGFVFRAGYTPLFFVTTDKKQVVNWGGLSLGYRF